MKTKSILSTLLKWRYFALALMFYLFAYQSFTQDLTWWDTQHNWDGKTPRHHYLSLSTGGLGPNALPVLELGKGKISNHSYIEIAQQGHFNNHETTLNLYSKALWVVVPNKVAVYSWIVPYERYWIAPELRDQKMLQDFDGEGFAGGDFYFGTQLQLLENNENLPDVMLHFGFKTASGTNIEAGRFTDTPGYYFDATVGKTIEITNHQSLRWYSQIGFYAWQTYVTQQRQNDAFMYGLGMDILLKHWTFSAEARGMIGYQRNGDRPLVLKINALQQQERLINLQGFVQYGIFDYNYISVQMGVQLNLNQL